jgi:hypothetical protein
VLWERSVVEQRYDAVMEVVRDGLAVTVVAERYGSAARACTAGCAASGLVGWRA